MKLGSSKEREGEVDFLFFLLAVFSLSLYLACVAPVFPSAFRIRPKQPAQSSARRSLNLLARRRNKTRAINDECCASFFFFCRFLSIDSQTNFWLVPRSRSPPVSSSSRGKFQLFSGEFSLSFLYP